MQGKGRTGIVRTLDVESCQFSDEADLPREPTQTPESTCPPARNESSIDPPACHELDWRSAPLHKQLLLGLFFFAAFLISDGSSTAAQAWEGAPPWYLPVGLSLVMLLCGGMRYLPLIFIASAIASSVNYHWPIFSWCGLPGSVAVYLGYIAGALILRGRWRVDLRFQTLRDVGRYLAVCLGAAVLSAAIGTLTLLGDGRIRRSDALWATAQWWASDALAIISFTPFVLLHIAPRVGRWLHSKSSLRRPLRRRHFLTFGILELMTQCGFAALVIWLLFGYAPASPYQPLYLLFVPVIWVAVRRGLPGAVAITFAISVGMTFAAWVTQAHHGSLPRLQLAMLALGLTGLCLGAVVTEQKRVARAVRESEKRYRLLFERNLAGVLRTTLPGRILECNQAAASMLGYHSPKEVLALPVGALYQMISDREAFLTKIKSEKYLTNHELRLRRKSGELAWAMLNVTLVEGHSGAPDIIEGTLVDITERKVAEEKVQSLAYFDALTGLPNRLLLHDRLSKALAAAHRQKHEVALLFLDIDRFKVINDSLGHSVGDLLLKEIADRLNRCARDQDTVARLGGDEFLIVLTNVEKKHDVAVAARRFMDAITAGFCIQGHELTLSCSLGISIFPEHGSDSEILIKNADAAMYSAKYSGRNNFRVFEPSMNARAAEELAIENGLRSALAKNELSLVYQPQVDVVTNKISGVEALLRWQHPELGHVSPKDFIPVAENSGLIVPIGEWVLRTACAQARKWHDQGLTALSIAVNVSAVQFRQTDFPKTIRSVLQETGLDPQYLELELTESVLLSNADGMFSILQQLTAMGLRLAIDDFGTGYSSLSYLKRFPFSKLKIDCSFIRDIAFDHDDAAITAAIISMAKSLNVKVVAEGVETEEQMSFLRLHQCDAVQGYYFSKPLAVDEALVWLRGNYPHAPVAVHASTDDSPRGRGAAAN